MKKVLIVFTGGTIGSRKTNKVINIDERTSYLLIETYLSSETRKEFVFDTCQPLNILSENLIPNDWLTLIAALDEYDLSQYHGIIITHGTDTLPFTAAAVSYAFHYTPIPIILIGSNYPLDDPRNNGSRNFATAVDFILENTRPGVFVIFENRKGESIVHLGTRLTQAVSFTDEFDSANSIYYGLMANGIIEAYDRDHNPSLSALQNVKRIQLGAINFSSEVLYIKPYPGLDYSFFDFSIEKPKAILHDLYHSGTACIRNNGKFSLETFARYCNEHGVDVYVAPIRNISGDLYQSAKELIDSGVAPVENLSVEAALVKLMLAYGSYENKDDILHLLKGPPLFFERIH